MIEKYSLHNEVDLLPGRFLFFLSTIVEAFLDILAEKPKIIEAPNDEIVSEHGEVVFHCQATGDPEPLITWKKQKGIVPDQRQIYFKIFSSIYIIVNQNFDGTLNGSEHSWMDSGV